MGMADSANSRLAGRVAFTYPDFTVYELARFFIVAALEMQSVAVGWQVYEITKRALDLGLVGLAQFLPGMLLFLLSGHVADRFDRRKVLLWCYAGFALCSALLLGIAWHGARTVHLIYVVLVLLGVVRSLNAPASRALLPQLVLENIFRMRWLGTRATSRPRPSWVQRSEGSFMRLLVDLLPCMQAPQRCRSSPSSLPCGSSRCSGTAPQEEVSLASVLAGFHYIWRQKIILGSISLDMFAVLQGGAVSDLRGKSSRPGPGALACCVPPSGVGAAIMAVLVAHRPLRSRVGATMLWCVAGIPRIHDSVLHFA